MDHKVPNRFHLRVNGTMADRGRAALFIFDCKVRTETLLLEMVDEQELEVLDVCFVEPGPGGLMDEHDPTFGIIFDAPVAVETRIEVSSLADIDLTHGVLVGFSNEDVASCVLK